MPIEFFSTDFRKIFKNQIS